MRLPAPRLKPPERAGPLFHQEKLVAHAVRTTRRLQPEGGSLLKTASADAVACND